MADYSVNSNPLPDPPTTPVPATAPPRRRQLPPQALDLALVLGLQLTEPGGCPPDAWAQAEAYSPIWLMPMQEETPHDWYVGMLKPGDAGSATPRAGMSGPPIPTRPPTPLLRSTHGALGAQDAHGGDSESIVTDF